jgi:protein gp37
VGEETGIAWTHHTFNPWWGCEKVSPACTSCYAEAQALRWKHHVWGRTAPRRFFGSGHWNEPHAWDIHAKAAGERRRVFCASMADVFEDRKDLDVWRAKLWDLIDTTRGLDWLLLTKRPQNIRGMVPAAWLKAAPDNVWYGTTVENQEQAEKRIPELVKVPARIRFLSCEPLLEPLNLELALGFGSIHWVITGGESGPRARLTEQAWIENLIDQGRAAGAAVFVKQLGTAYGRKFYLTDPKGAEAWEWPGHLRVQDFPQPQTEKESTS